MPQMSPIGWLSLFIIFSLTFIMFNMMNYYMTIYKFMHKLTENKFNNNNNKSLNWMW